MKGYFLCLTYTNNVDDEGMKLIHLQTLFRQFEVHTHIYIPMVLRSWVPRYYLWGVLFIYRFNVIYHN